MTEVLFYEKPGCVNNTRQKTLLRGLGHQVEERDLLRTAWTPQRLVAFFGDLPVAQWFNVTAPRVKSGEIVPEATDAQTALGLMVADPLLIRRPLIETEFGRVAGFDPCEVLERLGVSLEPDVDLQTCVRGGVAPACPAPGGVP